MFSSDLALGCVLFIHNSKKKFQFLKKMLILFVNKKLCTLFFLILVFFDFYFFLFFFDFYLFLLFF
tara:strand:- start:207 stop:404 length:198 start_codon:yes stop_codon:yes gene_type:complete